MIDRHSQGQRPASNGQYSLSRPFTTSQYLSKKGKAPKDTPVPDNQRQRKEDAEIDPYDYSELQAGIDKAVVRLKDAMTKTRSAGRISSDMIENLAMEMNVKNEPGHSGQSRKESGRLSDYATVVPKGGRLMQVYISEEAVRSSSPHLSMSALMIFPAHQTHLVCHTSFLSLPHASTRRPEPTSSERTRPAGDR